MPVPGNCSFHQPVSPQRQPPAGVIPRHADSLSLTCRLAPSRCGMEVESAFSDFKDVEAALDKLKKEQYHPLRAYNSQSAADYNKKRTNSLRVGTYGTCYVTIACICTLCNDLYYVNSFAIFFLVLYMSYMNVFIYLAVCTRQFQMHI